MFVRTVVKLRRNTSGCMIADAESSALCLDDAFRLNYRGYYGGIVFAVENGLPIIRPFALPCKRFTKAPILEKANRYLKSDETYDEIIKHDGMPIMYDDRGTTATRQPVGLASSTVWRWLSWLGEMHYKLHVGIGQIRKQISSDLKMPSEVLITSTRRCRTQLRRDTLNSAAELLAINGVYEKLFGKEFFPRFAMAAGWS